MLCSQLRRLWQESRKRRLCFRKVRTFHAVSMYSSHYPDRHHELLQRMHPRGQQRHDFCQINGDHGMDSFLSSNGTLLRGDSLWSRQKATRLTLQYDGNLVLYDFEPSNSTQKAIWASGTVDKEPFRVVMQPHGDLVLVAVNGTIVWRLGTGDVKNLGVTLLVQDDDGGRICLSKRRGTCLWASTSKEQLTTTVRFYGTSAGILLDKQA